MSAERTNGPPRVTATRDLELDYITVRGFKSIASMDQLRLTAVNVLIGPNGSGKSNFIGIFSFLNALRDGLLKDYVSRTGGAERILHFGSKTTPQLYLKVSFRGGVNQYEIEFVPTANDTLVPRAEFVYFWDKSKYDQPYARILSGTDGEAGVSALEAQGVASYVRNHLARWRLYHFHDTSFSSPMKKTADVNDNRFLRTDGANLAAFLYFLKNRHAESYGLIRRTVRLAAPFFEDFQLEPSRLNPDKIQLEWRHAGSDAYFNAASLSDGTLRFIALTTLFLQPEAYRPSVVLIDEPELGLHPNAITLLAAMVKQAATETQVIVSTQSSLLLDHFQPEDVLVAERVEGGTRLTRLEPNRLRTWLAKYSLGQLWEKNELGGRPAPEN